jgi:hypothetical protein
MDLANPENNKITFTLQKEEPTLFKIVIETNEVYLNLRDQAHGKVIAMSYSNQLEASLPKGSYEL